MVESYAYRVRSRDGRLVEGSIEADGEGAVANRLRAQGLIPIEITREGKVSMKSELHILPQRVKLKDLAVFSRQFATMIHSGLSLLRSLQILADQTENPMLAKSILVVKEDVEKGSSLSASMSKHPKVFNKLYCSMVKAGETGGQLDLVLRRVADTFEAEHNLRQKIKSAMTYPIVVSAIALLMLTVMLIFIVPVFAKMFKGLGGTLPLPTQLLVSLSHAARFLGPLAIVGVVVGRIVYKKGREKSADFRLRTDQMKLKAPVFGNLFQKVAMSRFSRTLALLLRAGVPVLQALDIVADTSGNEVLARAAYAVRESVRKGESIHTPLSRHPVFPPMVVQMLAVGEDTGAVDDMLERVADFYDREVESTTESLTALIEPLMIAVLGGIVGGMVIALYMPMFKIYDLIK
ncbi:MAG: type pilus assembly protein PilC [Actinomycetota bacterium]|jgi:type IV pilus assembly protein PilC|nr:type pilus assembly protein PilC [Actinomycetota bacterium]